MLKIRGSCGSSGNGDLTRGAIRGPSAERASCPRPRPSLPQRVEGCEDSVFLLLSESPTVAGHLMGPAWRATSPIPALRCPDLAREFAQSWHRNTMNEGNAPCWICGFGCDLTISHLSEAPFLGNVTRSIMDIVRALGVEWAGSSSVADFLTEISSVGDAHTLYQRPLRFVSLRAYLLPHSICPLLKVLILFVQGSAAKFTRSRRSAR